MVGKIRILLADDHALLRQGTAELLQHEIDFEIVGQAENGLEAVRMAHEIQPDIIVMDVRMPVLSGVEATRQIRKELPQIQVLVLTAYDDDQYVFSLLQAGASGYLLKTAPATELIRSIHQVRAGESPLSPVIARKVVARLNAGSPYDAGPEGAASPDALTPREVEILQFLARGLSNRDIAEALYISDRTVQAHLTNIFAKMQVSSRLEAVLKGIRMGWLTLHL
jgi:two-component system, NarL family, response regulator LiaR